MMIKVKLGPGITPERIHNCIEMTWHTQALLARGLGKVKWMTKINGNKETHGEKGAQPLIRRATVADLYRRQRGRLTPELPPAITLI